MKGYLYKLKEGYVLCSDEQPKSGDLVLALDTQLLFTCNEHEADKPLKQFKHLYKKVLTQSPILSSLSPDKQKEIGWFDVEKLAKLAFKDKFKKSPIIMGSMEADSAWLNTWANGFQKHAELTADRRFTEEDMLQFYYWLKKSYGPVKPLEEAQIVNRTTPDKIVEMFRQTLQQPKSWEVEYQEENGVYKILSIKNNT